MGRPVVHFEICGRDAARLREYYGEIFGWKADADNPLNYGIIAREDNLSDEGIGIGGGIAEVPQGYDGHVTVYVQVPDVEQTLAQAEKLGGSRMMGPESPMEGLVIGLFKDPSGNVVGVIQGGS